MREQSKLMSRWMLAMIILVVIFCGCGKGNERAIIGKWKGVEGKETRRVNRMTQIQEAMKEKAKEFTAYQTDISGERVDLALLPEPIYTYTDDERNLDFGAVFAFAHGKNPEALLVFEYRHDRDTYGCELARLSGVRVHIVWKGHEIWQSELGNGHPISNRIPISYSNFRYSDLERLENYRKRTEAEIRILPGTIKDLEQAISNLDDLLKGIEGTGEPEKLTAMREKYHRDLTFFRMKLKQAEDRRDKFNENGDSGND